MPKRTDEEGDLRGRLAVRRLEDIDVVVRSEHRVTADPLDLGTMFVDPVGDLAFEFLDEFRLGDSFGRQAGEKDIRLPFLNLLTLQAGSSGLAIVSGGTGPSRRLTTAARATIEL